jgi:hypothetical protein
MMQNPMKATLSESSEVDRPTTAYASVGIPRMSESRLFQRTVKKFSFVMVSTTPDYRFSVSAILLRTVE